MKKLIFLIVIFTIINNTFSQSVSINTTGSLPDASAMLDISSVNKGILIPRMADHTSVGTPAQGVMVFNTTTQTFWFFNGLSWIEITNTGPGGSTLDQAYDFGGAGNGRIITADAGAVEINNGVNTAHFINIADVANFTNGSDVVSLITTGTSVGTITTSTKERALTLTNSNAVSYGLYSGNTNTGVAIYGETTNTTNLYSAVQGVSNYGSTTAGSYPSGVSGYFDGAGMGVGVWGETKGNGTSAGAGVYGMSYNNNFGVWGFSDAYPGLYAKTNSTGNPALQIASGANSRLNPAIYAIGSSQFDCSTSSAQAVHINNVGGEPSVTPTLTSFGYIGTSAYAWYYLYYYNAVQVVKKETNRNINYLNDNSYDFIMKDIDKIKPAFYKYKIETDFIEKGNESKYRPNMHFGVILEDAPDYIQDNAFSGVDVYAIATLSLAGVKYNRNEIQELKQTINDFGIVKMKNNEIWISFDNKFASKLKDKNIPVVTLTTNSSDTKVYISEQNNKGFRIIAVGNTDNLLINWIAMAKTDATEKNIDFETQISPELFQQLVVPDNIKLKAKELHKRPNKQKVLNLLDTDDSNKMPSSKRFVNEE
ncbi:MAG: hypothetical protein L3J35_08525 [Bacteroidales bacterium]|nr:hypothetical protein [Bacteroidales bacterium]